MNDYTATKIKRRYIVTIELDVATEELDSDVEMRIDETIENVLEGLKSLIAVFRDLDTPFYCIPDTNRAPRFNDYEHVSRLKEWAALDGDSDGEAA